MKRRLALLALAPLLLCAGICGSVLRGHHPDGWSVDHDGFFKRRFGAVEAASGWLIRREGSGFQIRLGNGGIEPLRIDGIDLDLRGIRHPWDGKADPVPPGGRVELRPHWPQECWDARCAVILRTSAGELRIDLVEGS